MVSTRVLFGADIETTGLDPFRDRILGIAFSHKPGFAVHFDWPSDEAREILARQPICMHNGTFDTLFLRINGCEKVNYLYDTRWAQHVIAPEMPKDLATLGSIYTDYPRWKEVDDKDAPKKYKGKKIATVTRHLPRETVRFLCCRDADATISAFKHLEAEMIIEGVYDVYNSIMMPLAKTCIEVRLRGMRIDLKECGKAYRDSIKWTRKLELIAAKQGWSLTSPIQVKKLLQQTGLYVDSTGKEVLEKLTLRYPDHAILHMVLAHRRSETDRKLYKGILSRLFDGRIHTDYDPSGTGTGRLASKDPNLQNVAPRYRNIFIPDDGMGLMQGDYSRLELRVMAVRSGDAKMVQDIWERDFHKEYRLKVYGTNDVDHDQVLRAKAIVFGTAYGRSARSIAVEFGIPVQQAQDMQDVLMKSYPTFSKQVAQDIRTANTDGVLRSPFGRVRHFAYGNIAGKAVNFPIQSSAADITFGSFIQLENECHNILLNAHDAVVLQYPLGQEKFYHDMMKDIMERPIPQLGHKKFPVEIKTGLNWRDMEVYNARN